MCDSVNYYLYIVDLDLTLQKKNRDLVYTNILGLKLLNMVIHFNLYKHCFYMDIVYITTNYIRVHG